MNCPVCKIALTIADRSGVEIDYCPQCRGVWLDRGELDKLIERAAAPPARAQYAADERRAGSFAKYDDDDDDAHGQHRRKRKSFLGEMFDFD